MLKIRNVILTEEKKRQVLGGEVAMWTEQVNLVMTSTIMRMREPSFYYRGCKQPLPQVDTYSVESKIFPRADALAERLWSNPAEKWYAAEQRMLQQRWRLTHRDHMIRQQHLQQHLSPNMNLIFRHRRL